VLLEFTSIERQMFKKGMTEPFEMKNWNYMLPGLIYGEEGNGVDGLKTGNTDLAGFCFTGTAKRDGMRLISVVMKTDSVKSRFAQTKKLFDYGFENFRTETLLDTGYTPKDTKTVPVMKGKGDQTGIE